VAIDVINHMTKPELARLGRLLRTALKPGGLLFLQTPNGERMGPGRRALWVILAGAVSLCLR
jgi:2-polyprenyl-3-methyl-5-hydroxy-6-metoxy-1,4-benzoquinol methylase